MLFYILCLTLLVRSLFVITYVNLDFNIRTNSSRKLLIFVVFYDNMSGSRFQYLNKLLDQIICLFRVYNNKMNLNFNI